MENPAITEKEIENTVVIKNFFGDGIIPEVFN